MMIPRQPMDFNPLKNPEANREAFVRTLHRIKIKLSFFQMEEAHSILALKTPHFIEYIKSRN